MPAAIALALGLLGSFATLAQPATDTEGPLVLHAYKLQHQPAFEALPRVYSLLSERGTVEVKKRENELVVRDDSWHVRRIVQMLNRFDHPREQVRFEISIVRATAEQFSPVLPSPQVPERMLEQLRDLLPYHSYKILAETRLEAWEDEVVNYQLGDQFRVRFRVGTLLEEQRLQLYGFQVLSRQNSAQERNLIEMKLNLKLAQTLFLALAPTESSKEALMVVVTATRLQER